MVEKLNLFVNLLLNAKFLIFGLRKRTFGSFFVGEWFSEKYFFAVLDGEGFSHRPRSFLNLFALIRLLTFFSSLSLLIFILPIYFRVFCYLTTIIRSFDRSVFDFFFLRSFGDNPVLTPTVDFVTVLEALLYIFNTLYDFVTSIKIVN
jgi:hypothetical protein